MNYQGTALAAVSDDTIEIQLTSEDLLQLAQAAEAAELPSPHPTPIKEPPPQIALPEYGAPPFRDAAPMSMAGLACSAAAFVAFAIFVWWSVDHLFGQSPTPPVAAVSRSSKIARPSVPPTPELATASQQQQSVLVRNPFDRTEVFEFPPGTSQEEGREKVAALLLQRARERRSQWNGVRATENLRAANFYRAP